MCVKIRRNGRERPLLQVVDDWPELTGSANVGRLGLKLKLIIVYATKLIKNKRSLSRTRVAQDKANQITVIHSWSLPFT